MKITAARSRVVWRSTRLLFIAVPTTQAIGHVIGGDQPEAMLWGAVAIMVATQVHLERWAFHHGFHFGQVMIMWCLSHDVSPSEFAELPDPEPWDLPWHEKEDDHE